MKKDVKGEAGSNPRLGDVYYRVQGDGHIKQTTVVGVSAEGKFQLQENYDQKHYFATYEEAVAQSVRNMDEQIARYRETIESYERLKKQVTSIEYRSETDAQPLEFVNDTKAPSAVLHAGVSIPYIQVGTTVYAPVTANTRQFAGHRPVIRPRTYFVLKAKVTAVSVFVGSGSNMGMVHHRLNSSLDVQEHFPLFLDEEKARDALAAAFLKETGMEAIRDNLHTYDAVEVEFGKSNLLSASA